jgi:hypothetical protein
MCMANCCARQRLKSDEDRGVGDRDRGAGEEPRSELEALVAAIVSPGLVLADEAILGQPAGNQGAEVPALADRRRGVGRELERDAATTT